jgi:hypothetical protein
MISGESARPRPAAQPADRATHLLDESLQGGDARLRPDRELLVFGARDPEQTPQLDQRFAPGRLDHAKDAARAGVIREVPPCPCLGDDHAYAARGDVMQLASDPPPFLRETAAASSPQGRAPAVLARLSRSATRPRRRRMLRPTSRWTSSTHGMRSRGSPTRNLPAQTSTGSETRQLSRSEVGERLRRLPCAPYSPRLAPAVHRRHADGFRFVLTCHRRSELAQRDRISRELSPPDESFACGA